MYHITVKCVLENQRTNLRLETAQLHCSTPPSIPLALSENFACPPTLAKKNPERLCDFFPVFAVSSMCMLLD